MRYFSLFAGAGGGELAGLLLGWQLAGVVEKNKYCQEVLRARMFDGILPTLCIHDEIQSFSGHGWRSKVDLVIAAPPCQPWSQAGKRLGEDDPRNLWPETMRVVREIQPPLFFMEQSSRLASNAYFGKVLADLAQSGYDTQWSCLSAREVGAPHKRRDRLWLLAYLPDALRHTLRIQPWWSEWSSGANASFFEHDGPIQSVADTLCCGWRRESARGIGVCESARSDGSARCDHPVRGPGDGSEQARCVAYPWSNGLRPVHCTWWDEDPADQEDASESQMGRVADGMAARVDRLKALGNGWIPQVACVAFVGLMHRALRGLAKDDV